MEGGCGCVVQGMASDEDPAGGGFGGEDEAGDSPEMMISR